MLHCTGFNSGALNSGALNSGALNSGALNSGVLNSGALNSGARNSALPRYLWQQQVLVGRVKVQSGDDGPIFNEMV